MKLKATRVIGDITVTRSVKLDFTPPMRELDVWMRWVAGENDVLSVVQKAVEGPPPRPHEQ